ncbi:MAG: hypothetical protein U1F39_09045 [Steroidobacteraceae bacterium]
MRRVFLLLAVVLALSSLPGPAVRAAGATDTAHCDRACLYGFVDRYLDALAQRDARRLPWSRGARYSENNVLLAIGDGMWGTTTALGDYKLRFADVKTGQVGFFGVVHESENRSAFALRLKIHRRQITEAEAVVVRLADLGSLDGGPNPFFNARFEDKPILLSDLKPSERRPRDELVAVANGYFETLQKNDGRLFTRFHPDCNRVENGVLSTNSPTNDRGAFSSLGCEAQFRLGMYRFDDRLRDRRYPLVDEERGIVLSAGFIDHTGTLASFPMTDGRIRQSPLRRPHSFYLLELFKIVDGQIRQVESAFVTVPYGMVSAWPVPRTRIPLIRNP